MKPLLFALFFSFYITHGLVCSSYPCNDQVPIEVWTSLEPYFLPSNHPIKPKLDYLFKKRISLSKSTLEQAGFSPIYERKPTNIRIGRHSALRGYILKLFLDTQPQLTEWKNWIDRIEGAKVIKEAIKKNKFSRFDVPKKWIYPLPKAVLPVGNYHAKHFILVVEDMNLLSSTENKKAYQEKVSSQTLRELFFLLTDCGLLDSVYIDNIPFNKSGRICFVDTEHHHKWPVPYERLTGAFSPKMQLYWKKLIEFAKDQN